MLTLAFRYGAWMFLGFSGLFLLMHLIGLSDTIELRVLNAVIHLAVLWFALRTWLYGHPERADNYVGGTALGVLTTTVGTAAFTILLTIFLAYNPGLMASIREQSPAIVAEQLNPVTTSAFVFMEGSAVGLIASYIIMRILEARYYRSV